MKINRLFTKKGQPYLGIKFAKRSSQLKNSDGSKASHEIEVEVPDFWSQVATDILAQKYLRRAGLPEVGSESDARQVFHRLAGCWTHWGKKYGYFDSAADAEVFYDETCYMLAQQMAAPNSPQWFNTGLHFAYGLSGPAQGHYYVDPESSEVLKSTSAYERPQPHACFIQAINDDLVNDGGIMDLWVREARLFKYGSGTGTNFSRLRGEGEKLSGGGVSSGLLSFLKIGDAAAGAIKSGGTTRRAAKMVCLDVDHPDISEFISWKVNEEQKVAALVAGSKAMEKHVNAILLACQTKRDALGDKAFDPKENPLLKVAVKEARLAFIPMGIVERVLDLSKTQHISSLQLETFNTDWNSKAYQTVAGQNSNNSIRLMNNFLDAVASDSDWQLHYRTSGTVAKTLKARKLWEDICYAAWACADPGLQFDTTINEWHTCPKDGRINASNPCSEYMFLDDTACNLASLNLMKFAASNENGIDIEKFRHACRIWTIILDISVQMAQFPSKEIALNSWNYRTLGLGYANIGALLMQMGIPYGSEQAQAITGAITAIMCGEAYKTSAELAADLGPFPRYEQNKNDMLRVMRNHRRAARAEQNTYEGLTIAPMLLRQDICPKALFEEANLVWDQAYQLGEKHGYRNAQTTVIAPTGTIGLVMDCDTTGIEPDYALVKFKKLAGGGYFKIINQSIPPALSKLGYSEAQIKEIVDYCVGHGSLSGAPAINHDSLKARGFDKKTLTKVEKELAQAFDISFVFNKWSLGEDFCVNTLKLSKEQIEKSDVNILKLIGFSDEEIQSANEYACGTMTVEGAPHLREEHLAVFDCATRCGRKGVRYIAADAHLKMMAAAQPFISGAISKTINLPHDASIDDVKDAYLKAWKWMTKAIALYRDGSKLSQALYSATSDSDVDETSTPMEQTIQLTNRVVEKTTQAIQARANQRRRLPGRRDGYTQKVKIGGHSFYLRTGEYEDGSLGEIFLDINKEGTLLRSMMNAFAIAVSLGLQYGVPLEEYIDVFTFSRFEPNGPVVGHDNIKRSTSIIDFLFRDLAINYLSRHDLAHVAPEEVNEPRAETKRVRKKAKSEGFGVSMINSPAMHVDGAVAAGAIAWIADSETDEELEEDDDTAENSKAVKEFDSFAKKYSIAKMKGYSGDPCSECGALTLVRNGSCLKCDSCGATTGCS